MERRLVLGIMLTLLLMGMFAFAFSVQPVDAYGETIYIRADGSIDPPTANITSSDNVTYTFTGNINMSIVVERDNIIIDGAEYTLQSPYEYVQGNGVTLEGRKNVTITNVRIGRFDAGIYLYNSNNSLVYMNTFTDHDDFTISLNSSSHNVFSENTMIRTETEWSHTFIWVKNHSDSNIFIGNTIVGGGGNTAWGLVVYNSSDNTIVGNNINTSRYGIELMYANYTTASHNNLTNNRYGIYLWFCDYNTISDNSVSDNNHVGMGFYDFNNNLVFRNTIMNCTYAGMDIRGGSYAGEQSVNNAFFENNIASNNGYGFRVWEDADNNTFFHNNVMNNSNLEAYEMDGSVNHWDDGYPSGGNYWGDYNGTDFLSGPNQTEPGSDGIGDTPYIILEYLSQDNYPLINPWSTFATRNASITKGGTVYPIQVTSNATILDIKETLGSLKLSVSGANGTSGYVRAIQPIGLNSSEIKVFLNKTKLTFPSHDPPASISENSTHYFIYFAFTFNSTYELTIAFPIEGDANYDGTVDIIDVVFVAVHFGAEEGYPDYDPHADLNDDGTIDIIDIVLIAIHFGETW